MRVMIVHYNPAEPGKAGGAESAIRDQKRALEMLGHEVELEFVSPQRGYARFQPDIMHFHTVCVEMGLSVLRWAADKGIPRCLSVHDYWPFCGSRMLLANGDKSCSAVTGKCDGQCISEPAGPGAEALVNSLPVVTFNEYSAAIYRRHGIRVDAVIPHGIDTDYFSPAPEQREMERIVMVSAWANYPTKGAHVLRAALAKIGTRAALVTGVTRERVRDELRKSDIMVFPSCYEETWGLCLTEAMACGCAGVASNVCGSRAQIEHGETGLLFENRNADELAVHLRHLLDNPAEARRLGHNARAHVEHEHSLEAMGSAYDAFYRKVTNG